MVRTKIEWAEQSWNPVIGCTPVSEGCDNCYARRMAYRLRGRCGYPQNEPFKVTLHEERILEPYYWHKPRRIFVCSMSDLFHPEIPDEFIYRVLLTMQQNPRHTFLLLSKRPERILRWNNLQKPWNSEEWPQNIWVGVTAENQKRADERIPILLQIPAAVRFVSCEPLLGPVDLSPYLGNLYFCNNPRHGQLCPDGIMYAKDKQIIICRYCKQPVEIVHLLDWVICGGETGPGARPMHPDWVRNLRDQCMDAGVPFFFKSWGDWAPCWGGGMHLVYQDGRCMPGTHEHPDAWREKVAEPVMMLGKKAAGRILDGRTWDDFPEV
ncbi:MAG TPA: phage Gp37/Gp68 family protein [Thermoanaerobacterales bacterium]|nr:phage Gp37/Gp68 family protein [Thermoanaerobacterales bacterium]